jgi:lysyl-tRNA synthetase, class II
LIYTITMANLEELRQARRDKLELLTSKGINPYPAEVRRDFALSHVVEKYEALATGQKVIHVAGRVMSMRAQGALIFFDLFDGTAKLQSLLKLEDGSTENTKSNKEIFDLFNQTVDIGDFLEVSGTLFTTKRGEKTVQVTGWNMLTKSLLPLPEKFHGLQDVEERFRKRYLDILMNAEVRDMFVKRSTFWQSMRNFLIEEGFMEVETPVLENTTGGADARPFVTHHNALDIDVYLRISAGELWQKRLMVAGYPKTFEIGRIFRNEGQSAEHAQDYTQMEFYWGYADYKMGMEMVERLYKHIALQTFGTLKFTIGTFEIDLDSEWKKYDYADTIKEMTGIDIWMATEKEIERTLAELKVKYEKKGWNKTRAIDMLWKYCRKQIAGPGFLINVPVFMEPLAKRRPEDTNTVERFQVLLAGSEMGKGYSELNDPIDQKERFEEQAKLREAGDDEAQMNDTEFVEALEYGMPPTCGFGISERLFSFLMNKPIHEAQMFPLMRPRTQNSEEKKEE